MTAFDALREFIFWIDVESMPIDPFYIQSIVTFLQRKYWKEQFFCSNTHHVHIFVRHRSFNKNLCNILCACNMYIFVIDIFIIYMKFCVVFLLNIWISIASSILGLCAMQSSLWLYRNNYSHRFAVDVIKNRIDLSHSQYIQIKNRWHHSTTEFVDYMEKRRWMKSTKYSYHSIWARRL